MPHARGREMITPYQVSTHYEPDSRGPISHARYIRRNSCGLVVCEETGEGSAIQPEQLVTAGSLLLKDGAAVDVACADPYNS